MDERMVYITTELQKVADDVCSAFGELTAEQLNWKPRADAWSVGQCLDHLILTNEKFYPEMDRLSAGNRKNSFIETWSPLTGFFGRFLIKAVSEDSKKSKVPSKEIVPPSDISSEIVRTFEKHVGELNEKLNACAGIDRQRTVVTSPFLAIFTYTLDDAYTVLVEHTKRHVRQAKRVVETAGFPS